jgi:hypothetical protein
VGVGIGAAVAMFSAINAALLRRRERTARHRQADLPDLESVVPLSSHRLEARRYGTCPMPQATASTPRSSPHQRTHSINALPGNDDPITRVRGRLAPRRLSRHANPIAASSTGHRLTIGAISPQPPRPDSPLTDRP